MENKLVTFLVIATLIIGVVFTLIVVPKGISDEDIQIKIDNAVNPLNTEIANKNTEISNLNSQVVDLNNQISTETSSEPVEVVQTETGYLIDELSLGYSFSKTLSDREVKTLLDSEVEFDDENYDFEEVIYLSNLKVSINQEDFKENAYLQVLEGGIEYKIIFDKTLNTSQISEDKTLKFNFLGKEIEVSEWDLDKIVISYGDEVMLNEGQSYQVEGKNLNVLGIYEDRVYLSVDNKGKSLKEGDTVTLNGLEIKVKEVLYSGKESQVSKVVLVASSKVEETIYSGDEFEEDSIWEYVITPNSIDLVLKEDFKELDDSDGFNVLSEDESICLPNDYVCVKYNGLSDEDTEKYTFDLNKGLVRIKGNFQSGLNDFDKVYFNVTSGLFYEDNDCKYLINGTLLLGDSDLNITVNTYNNLVIDNVIIKNDLTNIEVDSISIASNEDNYRTVYGIVIENPEDSVDDQEVTLTVPMKQLEASISVI